MRVPAALGELARARSPKSAPNHECDRTPYWASVSSPPLASQSRTDSDRIGEEGEHQRVVVAAKAEDAESVCARRASRSITAGEVRTAIDIVADMDDPVVGGRPRGEIVGDPAHAPRRGGRRSRARRRSRRGACRPGVAPRRATFRSALSRPLRAGMLTNAI